MGSTDHIIARGLSADGLSRPRLERMHDVMAAHVRGGCMPGLVTLVDRRGDVHVDAVGMQTLGGSLPMQRARSSASPR